MTRLIFHIGQPKTGSSALQAFLSTNDETLKSSGFIYPNRESVELCQAGVCSGNILHAMMSAARKDGFDGSKRAVLKKYGAQVIGHSIAAHPGQNLIFSWEGLGANAHESAATLFRDLNMHHEVKIVAYIRDVYDQAVSAWKQGVKAEGRSESFTAHLTRLISIEYYKNRIKYLIELVEMGLDVTFINYDHSRSRLCESFLHAIGLKNIDDFTFVKELKNPSLSFWQAHAVAAAAALNGGSAFSAHLLSKFLQSLDREPDPYLVELDELLLESIGEELIRLNSLIDEKDRLRTMPRQGFANSTSSADFNRIDQLVEIFVGYDRSQEGRGQQDQGTRQPGLPDDFDGAEYLLRNPDVAAAGVDPVFHYLYHGRFEKRVYKATQVR